MTPLHSAVRTACDAAAEAIWRVLAAPGARWDQIGETSRDVFRLQARAAIEAADRAAWSTDMEWAMKQRVCLMMIAQYPGSSEWTDIYQGWWVILSEAWAGWPHPFPPTHWRVLALSQERMGEIIDHATKEIERDAELIADQHATIARLRADLAAMEAEVERLVTRLTAIERVRDGAADVEDFAIDHDVVGLIVEALGQEYGGPDARRSIVANRVIAAIKAARALEPPR